MRFFWPIDVGGFALINISPLETNVLVYIVKKTHDGLFVVKSQDGKKYTVKEENLMFTSESFVLEDEEQEQQHEDANRSRGFGGLRGDPSSDKKDNDEDGDEDEDKEDEDEEDEDEEEKDDDMKFNVNDKVWYKTRVMRNEVPAKILNIEDDGVEVIYLDNTKVKEEFLKHREGSHFVDNFASSMEDLRIEQLKIQQQQKMLFQRVAQRDTKQSVHFPEKAALEQVINQAVDEVFAKFLPS